jgi:hypothetical protein
MSVSGLPYPPTSMPPTCLGAVFSSDGGRRRRRRRRRMTLVPLPLRSVRRSPCPARRLLFDRIHPIQTRHYPPIGPGSPILLPPSPRVTSDVKPKARERDSWVLHLSSCHLAIDLDTIDTIDILVDIHIPSRVAYHPSSPPHLSVYPPSDRNLHHPPHLNPQRSQPNRPKASVAVACVCGCWGVKLLLGLEENPDFDPRFRKTDGRTDGRETQRN